MDPTTTPIRGARQAPTNSIRGLHYAISDCCRPTIVSASLLVNEQHMGALSLYLSQHDGLRPLVQFQVHASSSGSRLRSASRSSAWRVSTCTCISKSSSHYDVERSSTIITVDQHQIQVQSKCNYIRVRRTTTKVSISHVGSARRPCVQPCHAELDGGINARH